MVRIRHLEGGSHRCDSKIKPGTPFCKEHFETHKLVQVECTGEAHQPGVDYDHCMVCAPHWGRYPVAVTKDAVGIDWDGSWE